MSAKLLKKIAFIDRDGTINVDNNYLYKIEEFEFLPGAIDGLKILQDKNFLLIIVTNQSGIGRGYYTEQDFHILNNWMKKILEEQYDIHIEAVYFCPHLPNAKIEKYKKVCNCRKPKIGMFTQAINDMKCKYNIDIKNSIAIGDNSRDLIICNKLGIQGYLLNNFDTFENIKHIHSILDAAKLQKE